MGLEDFEALPYTRTPNIYYDEIQPLVPLPVWSVLCVILRKTLGFHKAFDYISYSQFQKGTGTKSFTAISHAITFLEENQIVLVGHSTDRVTSNCYTPHLAGAIRFVRATTPNVVVTERDTQKKNTGNECNAGSALPTVAESRASILARYDADYGDCADVRAYHFKHRNKFNDACANSPTNLAMVAASNAAHLMGADVTGTPPPACGGLGKSELLKAVQHSATTQELALRFERLWR